MIRTSTFIFVCLVTAADALSSSVYVTRRAFWQGTAIGGSVGLILATTTSDVANAAYTREVGGPGASAEQAAYNIQARKTNERLELSGFKLDTKEEESARLAEALGSYTYTAAGSGTKTSSVKSKSRDPKKK